jgi:hypothetical protein
MNTLEVANTIKAQLFAGGKMKVWSWGANQWSCGTTEKKEPYLIFRVRGLKFKGLVKVILNSMDTYDVHFIKMSKGQQVVKNEISDVYFDELTEKIDLVVEYTGDDKSYKEALDKMAKKRL